jgi:hypothetical protein
MGSDGQAPLARYGYRCMLLFIRYNSIRISQLYYNLIFREVSQAPVMKMPVTPEDIPRLKIQSPLDRENKSKNNVHNSTANPIIVKMLFLTRLFFIFSFLFGPSANADLTFPRKLYQPKIEIPGSGVRSCQALTPLSCQPCRLFI